MKLIQPLVLLLFFSVFSQNNNSSNGESLLGSEIWLNPKTNTFAAKSQTPTLTATELNFNQAVNFNPESNTTRFKSIWNKKSTFFVVFKSEDQNEVPIFKVVDKNNSIHFTNKHIDNGKIVPFEKGDSKNGIILGYESSLAKVSTNNLIQFNDESFSAPESKTKIYEFIYIPETMSLERQGVVQTYLSIKYGISLDKEKSYSNIKGDTIWNAKQNKIFNNRITGLGNESEFLWSQKQSHNSEKDGLLIGLEHLKNKVVVNKKTLPDHAYVLWGDNNKKTILHKRNGLQTYQKMDRVWKMQTNGVASKDSVKLSFYIDAKKMKLSDQNTNQSHDQEEFVWLGINDISTTDNFDYQTATYYKQKAIQDSIVFEGISIKENQTFTFVKAPDLFATYQAQTMSCFSSNNNAIEGKIINGQAPFTIKIKGQETDKSFSVSTSEFQVPNLIFGTYTIQITDAQKRNYTSTITLEPFSNFEIDLPAQLQLQPNESIVIQPSIKGKDSESLKYTWTCENKVISNENRLSTQTPGNYKLIITTDAGCEQEISFRVLDTHDSSSDVWSVYPNPVKQNQFYTIRFNLAEESEVSILLFGMTGQLITNRKLGKIDIAEVKEYMSLSSGAYLLQVNINGILSTKKIIVE